MSDIMTVERARQVLADVIDLRKRWGQKVSTKDFNKDDLLDALVVLQQHNEDVSAKEVVRLKQQISGYKTSNTKLQKKLAAAMGDQAEKAKKIDQLRAALAQKTEELTAARVELDALR